LKQSYLTATVIAYIATHSDTLKWGVVILGIFGAIHQPLSVTIGMVAKMANIGRGGEK
jgi:hypothetical protein